jgi:hypothetical protein
MFAKGGIHRGRLSTALIVFGCVVASISSTASAGLIHSYSLNESPIVNGVGANDGTSAIDSVNGTNGRYKGGAITASGHPGSVNAGAHFDGNSSVYLTNQFSALISNLPNFTITAWFKVVDNYATQDRFIYDEGSAGDSPQFRPISYLRLAGGSGKVDFGINAPGTGEWHQAIINTAPMDSQKWYFVAATLSSTSGMAVYLYDQAGVFQGSATDGLTQHSNIGVNATIGAWTQGSGGSYVGPKNPFLGALDDIDMYDTSLTQSQVAALVPEPAATSLLAAAFLFWASRRRAGGR